MKQSHCFTCRGKWGEDKEKPELWKTNSSIKAPQDAIRHILRKPPSLQHTTEHNSYQKLFLQQPHPLLWPLATVPQPPPPSPASPPPPNCTPQRRFSIAAENHCKGCFTPPLQMGRNPSETLLPALFKGRTTCWWGQSPATYFWEIKVKFHLLCQAQPCFIYIKGTDSLHKFLANKSNLKKLIIFTLCLLWNRCNRAGVSVLWRSIPIQKSLFLTKESCWVFSLDQQQVSISELCITWHRKLLFSRGKGSQEGGLCRIDRYTLNTTVKGTLNYSLQTLQILPPTRRKAEQVMVCSVSSCKMPNLKFLLSFFSEEISLTIRLPNHRKDFWSDENEEIQKEERTSLVRAMSFQSTVMLDAHCTFLRAGHRAYVQTNHQQTTICRGIPVHFYKCWHRPTHKMQKVWDWWIKTYASDVTDIATKERCTTYNENLRLCRSLKKAEEETGTGMLLP